MPEIKLIISDTVFSELRSECYVYGLAHAGGNMFIVQAFGKIIEAIESGKDECLLKLKSEDLPIPEQG